jgi:hypothetical protein
LVDYRNLHVPEIVADSPKVHLEDEPLPSRPVHLILKSAVTGKSSHFTAVTSTSKAFDRGRLDRPRPKPSKRAAAVDFFFLMVVLFGYDFIIMVMDGVALQRSSWFHVFSDSSEFI